MKDGTAEERGAELQRGGQRVARSVGRGRQTPAHHLKSRGFFVVGEPVEDSRGAEPRLVPLVI